MLAYGQVTGTDLADEVVARAQERVPQAKFVAGDFMALDIPPESFDVVVAAEVISCVADQEGFVRKVSQVLRPGGWLMLSTPNPFVLQRSRVTPRDDRQVRHWLGPSELRRLLRASGLRPIDLRTVVPYGHGGILRLVNSPKLNALCSLVVAPERIKRAKEAAFLGHSIVLLARNETSAH